LKEFQVTILIFSIVWRSCFLLPFSRVQGRGESVVDQPLRSTSAMEDGYITDDSGGGGGGSGGGGGGGGERVARTMSPGELSRRIPQVQQEDSSDCSDRDDTYYRSGYGDVDSGSGDDSGNGGFANIEVEEGVSDWENELQHRSAPLPVLKVASVIDDDGADGTIPAP
jgi:hypothetical protein